MVAVSLMRMEGRGEVGWKRGGTSRGVGRSKLQEVGRMREGRLHGAALPLPISSLDCILRIVKENMRY